MADNICPKCDQHFASNYTMRRHFTDIHSKAPTPVVKHNFLKHNVGKIVLSPRPHDKGERGIYKMSETLHLVETAAAILIKNLCKDTTATTATMEMRDTKFDGEMLGDYTIKITRGIVGASKHAWNGLDPRICSLCGYKRKNAKSFNNPPCTGKIYSMREETT